MAKPVLSVPGFRILGFRIKKRVPCWAYGFPERARKYQARGYRHPEGIFKLALQQVSCSRQQFGESIGP